MRTIEQFQIRKIYAIGNALGIKASGSEDELHALVGGVTGKPDTYGLAIDLGNTNIEEMTPGGVVIKKDLWLLDGSYQLNGTRILDAIRREEEL